MTGYDFIDYLLDNFGVILSAIFLILFISYKLLEKYLYTKFDERLENLERDFQQSLAQLNRYHAISQSTLEKAFQKKIEVYEELLYKVKNRAKFINESPIYDEPDSEEEHLSHFLSVIELIERNILYVTSNLVNKYDVWYQSAKPYIKSSNDNEYEAWQHSFGTDEDRENAYYFGLPDKLKMMHETKAEYQAILECIDQDIRDIRSSLERPMNVTKDLTYHAEIPKSKDPKVGEWV